MYAFTAVYWVLYTGTSTGTGIPYLVRMHEYRVNQYMYRYWYSTPYACVPIKYRKSMDNNMIPVRYGTRIIIIELLR